MFILHGKNLVASRNFLVEQKEKARNKAKEIIQLEGKKLDLTQLKQALESASLFGKDKLVVIENLFSLPKSKKKKKIIDYIKLCTKSLALSTDLIIWEGKKIDGRKLKSFKKAKIKHFKLPAIIFKFLDSLQPDSPKQSILLLKETLKPEPPELVFYMLCRQVRNLIIAKDLGKKGLNMASWQANKFKNQAQKFTLNQLKKLHANLVKIDYEQKTGRANFSLEARLDLLIANL